MDNIALGRLDSKRHSIGNRVVHSDKFHRQILANRNHATGLNHVQLDLVRQAMLLQLRTNQRYRQTTGVHRHIHLLEQIRQRTDMILVTVGDEDTANLILDLHNIRKVGQHHVDAQ